MKLNPNPDIPAPKPTVYYRCYGKVNIGLHIKGKRPDGFHTLETLFYPAPIYDELTVSIEVQEPLPVLLLSGRPVPGNPAQNLVIKAWMLVRELFPELPAVRVRLSKAIPAGGGLGGGSSNAAAMLLALNELFELKMTSDLLFSLAQKLGADVPFFLNPQPAYATGIGDQLEPWNLELPYNIELVLPPGIHSDTLEAYKNLDLSACSTNINLKEVLAYPPESWKKLLKNDFELTVFKRYPLLPLLRDKLYEKGAIYAGMSGSGSTIFGLFPKLN